MAVNADERPWLGFRLISSLRRKFVTLIPIWALDEVNTNPPPFDDTVTDASLLAQVETGDRHAFGALVGRYQNLVCSIAYSIVGDFKRSEDLAQDTFISAWENLGTLRDRTKFRGWLGGIVRNLALKSLRGERHVSWEAMDESLRDPSSGPDKKMMDAEEQALVWKSLAALPETYREPLILYYREDQSVARVAEALGLSESNVRQRLSRGREMLRDRVVSTIERTLRSSRPGPAFTLTVIGALPGVLLASAGTAAAATTSGAAKTGAMIASAKAAAGTGWAGAFLGLFGGFFGAWVGNWASVQVARSDRQREYLKNSFRPFVVASIIYILPLLVVRLAGDAGWHINGTAFAAAITTWTGTFIAFLLWKSFQVQRRSREILIEDEAEGLTREPDTGLQRFANQWEGREWKSRLHCFGIPLIHIRFGNPAHSPSAPNATMFGALRHAPVARGWIAIGERAHGLLLGVGSFATGLFAMGGIAFGGVAFGGLSCGFVSFGGLALGALAIGGLSMGGWSWGGMAVGWMAFGGMALAWKAAYGGMAIAHEIAVGGQAIAHHANNPAAKAFMESEPFFVTSLDLVPMMSSPWAFVVIAAVSLMPVVLILAVGYRRKVHEIDLESSPSGRDAP